MGDTFEVTVEAPGLRSMVLQDNALLAAQSESAALLKEHFPEICRDYSAAYLAFVADPDNAKKKFTYKVNLGVTMSPKAGTILVAATIGWTVKHADATVGVYADDHPQLPLGDDDRGDG